MRRIGGKRRSKKFSLTEQEVYGPLQKQGQAEILFLWRYPREEMERLLDEAGISGRLAALGYASPRLSFGVAESLHFLKLEQAGEAVPLIDLRLSEESRIAAGPLAHRLRGEPLALLVIQWISLQNVRGRFPPGRLPLPGQSYPGLGVGRKLYLLLMRLARELGKDALAARPEYYHNAIFYREAFYFLDPREQGEFLALARDLAGLPVGEASRAIASGRLLDAGSGSAREWEPGEMLSPASRRLRSYFASQEYRREAERSARSLSFRLPAPNGL